MFRSVPRKAIPAKTDHSRPQRPRFVPRIDDLWPLPIFEYVQSTCSEVFSQSDTSDLDESVNCGLPVLGAGRSRVLVLTKRIVVSGDEDLSRRLKTSGSCAQNQELVPLKTDWLTIDNKPYAIVE